MISLLFAAALASCSQMDELTSPENEYAYTFKVADDAVTKASYGEDHIVFEKDDLVASYALTSLNTSTPVEVAEDGEKVITIKSSVALNAGDKVYAYYPYNSANDGASKTEVTLEIPRNQVSGDADAMPMVALPFTLTDVVNSDEATEVGTLEFLNLGSVIKLNIYSSDSKFQGETIENVTFIEEKAIAGSFTYDITDVDAENPAAISGYAETDVVVTGRATVGTSADDAGVYYMVVAPGKYKGKFVVRTNKADYTYDSSAKEREYSRATVKPLNINLASTNWVANDKYDTSIDSPREFVAFLKGTSADDTAEYTISADLNMDGYTITSASGFGGTLNGGDHTISNLVSSVPMFAENSGTISNLNIDETCSFTPSVNCVQFGALVGLDNGGTYNSISTAATIKITATANIESNIALGGIVGATNSASGATFDSCSNSGAITVDATNYSHWPIAMGGVVGWVKKAAFNECTNNGPLTLTAFYHNPFHQWPYVTSENTKDVDANTSVGGIVGKAWDINDNIPTGSSPYVYTDAAYGAYFEECKNNAGGVITITHTQIGNPKNDTTDSGLVSAGGIMGQGNGYVNYGQNWAPINMTLVDEPALGDYWGRQQTIAQAGGIVGKSWQGIGMNSCTNRGDIYVGYDQNKYASGRYKGAVGGLCGCNGYDKTTSNMRFSTNHGKITVRGYGCVNVGGICGANGSQRGNKVYKSATIDVQCRDESAVGGLLGFMEGGATNHYIYTSYCEADIKADAVGTNSYVISIGGLIGQCNTGSNVSNPSLIPYGNDSNRCHYSGNIVSNGQVKVGMVIGWITNDNNKVFGNEGTPIQVKGTLKRSGMDSPVEINSTNVEEYAIGKIGGGTVTIYLESVPAIKVMSLNLRESNLDERMPAIIEMIKGEKPDVIGLQEVKVLTGWDAIFESDSWKAVLNGVDDIYDGYRPAGQTNGFLYNPEVVEVSNTGFFYLGENYNTSGTANSWDDWQRTAIYATLTYKATGKKIFYINTHYPLNLDGCKNSSTLVEERIAALNTNKYPVIVVGDFNQTLSSGAFEGFKQSMRDARTYADECYSEDNKNIYTYNAFGDASAVRNKVDHIWYSHPALDAKYYETLTQEIRTYGDVDYLSDHYPISAVISF